VSSINDNGQVVGSYAYSYDPYPSLDWNGFFWDSKTNTTIELGNKVTPVDINNFGKIVGRNMANGVKTGFLWNNGQIIELGSFLPGGINDQDQIIGGMENVGSCSGYIWENGNFTHLPYCFDPFDINNLGQIVGICSDGTSEIRSLGCKWENGGTVLIDSASYLYVKPLAINDYGKIVGEIGIGEGESSHAFLWENGILSDLWTGQYWLREANYINNSSQIIGAGGSIEWPYDEEFESYYLKENDQIFNLSELIAASLNNFPEEIIEIDHIEGFNNKGQIILSAYSDLAGNLTTRSYLLTPNQPPTPITCGDQASAPGQVATVDADGSTDPEGNYPLTYQWTLTAPDGSSTVLDDPTSVSPSFTTDVPGDYVLTVVVTDSLGNSSEPVTVIVSTVNNPPVANAGPDQAVTTVGQTVILDGSQSSDPDDQDITYTWTIESQPECSNSILSDPAAVNPQFTPDCYGTYVFRLVCNDGYIDSAPDDVVVTFENVAPISDADGNQSIDLGQTALLDGSGSYDPNGDTITYEWNTAAMPSGADPQIDDPTAVDPIFSTDLAGEYVLNLIVFDGLLYSEASTVTIMVVEVQQDVTVVLQNSITAINLLLPGDFEKENQQKQLTKKINAALEKIEAGEIADAINLLENTVLSRTDGCALRGQPDTNGMGGGIKKDWIENCGAQAEVYPLIVEAIGLLEQS